MTLPNQAQPIMRSLGGLTLAGPGILPANDCCTSNTYCHDEATNPKGPNQCSDNCDCDGERTCSEYGWCQGDSGHCTPD